MTESFLPPEQKLFLRAVEVQPKRESFNWGILLVFLFNFAAWGGVVAVLARWW